MDKDNLILGFDSWVGGVANFERLHAALAEKGLILELLHLGSWGGDIGRPDIESYGNMTIRDIRYYRTNNLFDILKKLRPKAVLFLSVDVFAHRAMIRYCKLLNIPTIHLYHGLVSIQPIHDKVYDINILSQIQFVLKRVPKAFTKIWPLYIRSLFESQANFWDWWKFIKDIIYHSMGKYINVAATDSMTSACAIYTTADLVHAGNKYGYNKDSIYIVGNPDLGKFGISKENLGIKITDKGNPSKKVVYIDTGLIYTGLVFSGEEDFFNHLQNLKNCLKEQGLKLSIKLHPDHYRTSFPLRISKSGIPVVNDDEFLTQLTESRAAIVEPSTAALAPALLGLPLLLVAFNKLKNQKYGKLLNEYPRSFLLNDPTKTLCVLQNIEKKNETDVLNWIYKNSGPLPSNKMPHRVATLVYNLISQDNK